MDTNGLKKYLSGDRNVQVYEGLDGYVVPMLLRIHERPKVIKQIINAEKVAKFHKKTNDFVNKFISKRSSLGIGMKNLIRPQDTKFEIELSDRKTLKETKTLPDNFEIDGVVVVFNDVVSFTKLVEDDCFGLIVKDKVVSGIVESMFDSLWEIGEIV